MSQDAAPAGAPFSLWNHRRGQPSLARQLKVQAPSVLPIHHPRGLAVLSTVRRVSAPCLDPASRTWVKRRRRRETVPWKGVTWKLHGLLFFRIPWKGRATRPPRSHASLQGRLGNVSFLRGRHARFQMSESVPKDWGWILGNSQQRLEQKLLVG